MNTAVVNECELSTVLNTFVYMDDYIVGCEGKSLKEIVSSLDGKIKPGAAGYREYTMVKEAIKAHPEWENVRVLDQSNPVKYSGNGIGVDNRTDKLTDDYIQASTFDDGNGNIYVSYRGTGNGRWGDNAVGMYDVSTEMQEAAANYYDYVVEKYGLENECLHNGKKIIITGHSKGGNEAQYTYMAAKYSNLIKDCINEDGQGFSEAAIERFKRENGEEYYKYKLKNMYSICGDNDFVHDLGIVIIPEENTYFIETYGDELFSYHDLTYMGSGDTAVGIDEDGNEYEYYGSYTGLNWTRENGEIVHGEQGPVGQFAKRLSKSLMTLPPDMRDGISNTVMYLLESYMSGGEIIGNFDISTEDNIEAIIRGIPIVMDDLLNTPEGQALLITILREKGEQIREKHGIFAEAGFYLATIFIYESKLFKYLKMGIHITRLVFDAIDIIVNVAKEAIRQLAEFWESVREGFIQIFEGIGDWCIRHTAGGRYAAANPYVVVDTSLLLSYASKLDSINSRLVSLDNDLSRLYSKANLGEKFTIQSADMRINYSQTLKRCATYLRDTANEYNSIENELKNALQ